MGRLETAVIQKVIDDKSKKGRSSMMIPLNSNQEHPLHENKPSVYLPLYLRLK